MNSRKKILNYALVGAVQEEDSDAVHELLILGADPNYKAQFCDRRPLMESCTVTCNKVFEKCFTKFEGEQDQQKTLETDSIENFKTYALHAAVQEGDVDAVRTLLDQGADPNFRAKYYDSLISQCYVAEKELKISKLLVENGIVLNQRQVTDVFEDKNSDFIQEIVPHIVEHCQKNKEVILQFVYFELIRHCKSELGLDLLKFLLDHGLPVDDYFEEDEERKPFTPLHIAVINEKHSFIECLLDRGADINKKTLNSDEYTPLFLAVTQNFKCNKSIVKLLLRRGANINARSNKGYTALNLLRRTNNRNEIIRLLLDYGADLNLEDNVIFYTYYRTPYLGSANEILLKELAIMKFEGQYVSKMNLNRISKGFYNGDTRAMLKFIGCLEELQRMKDYDIFDGISLHEVLKMRKNFKKLILLTKKEEFVAAFQMNWDRKSLPHFSKDLDDIFNEAVRRRDVLLHEQEKIYESRLDKKFSLPAELMKMIVEFATEHLYFDL